MATRSEHDVQARVKLGGGGLMMCGCITSQGVGHARRITGNMKAPLYADILDDEFLQTLERYGLEKEEIIFQQDNDPSTPPVSPINGSRATRLACWNGQRSR